MEWFLIGALLLLLGIFEVFGAKTTRNIKELQKSIKNDLR